MGDRSPYGKNEFENNSQLVYTDNESSALETGHHRRANITELASLPLDTSQSVHGWRTDVCACCTIQGHAELNIIPTTLVVQAEHSVGCVCVRTTEMTLDMAIWHDGSY